MNTQNKPNALSFMVAATVLAATENLPGKDRVSKDGGITWEYKPKRKAFGVQRPGESYEAYQTRMSARRQAETERKRIARAELKAGIMDKATDTLTEARLQGTIMEQGDAVTHAILHTDGLTSRHGRIGTDTNPLPLEYGRDSALNETPQSARVTRNAQEIMASLTTSFKGFSKAIGKSRAMDLSETKLAKITRDETVYRNLSRAQRSKANPLLNIRQLDRAEVKRYASPSYTQAAPQTTVTVFTSTERNDRTKLVTGLKLGSKVPEHLYGMPPYWHQTAPVSYAYPISAAMERSSVMVGQSKGSGVEPGKVTSGMVKMSRSDARLPHVVMIPAHVVPCGPFLVNVPMRRSHFVCA